MNKGFANRPGAISPVNAPVNFRTLLASEKCQILVPPNVKRTQDRISEDRQPTKKRRTLISDTGKRVIRAARLKSELKRDNQISLRDGRRDGTKRGSDIYSVISPKEAKEKRGKETRRE